MRSAQKKNKFSKGEIREELLERQDLKILDSSASYIKNYISTPFGGVKTRDGTLNIDQVASTRQLITAPTITSEVGGTPSYLYDTTNYFESTGIESATDLVLYDWNLGVVPPDELVAYWKLDESSGNAIDSFSTNDLVEAGTVPTATGLLGGARGAYTASTNYFHSNTGGSSTTIYDKTLFWIEGWFKQSATTALIFIIGKGRIETTGWSVYYNNNVLYFDLASQRIFANGSAYLDNNWHYVFACQRASSGTNERRIYVDGSLFAQGTGVTFTKAPFSLTMGVNGSVLDRAWTGTLDEFGYGDLTSSSKSWTNIEDQIITPRYNSGIGKKYAV